MATTYGNTWWGAQWLNALSSIDYSNRLPRGASYARRGMVVSIAFESGAINAKVQGSRRAPYNERIELPLFTEAQVEQLIARIKERPLVVSKLLNRQLDPALEKIAALSGARLFPSKWSDLRMGCSCPDWAVPCKHLAAVIYKTSLEIDNDPFLIFKLHGVDLLAELEKHGILANGEPDALSIPEPPADSYSAGRPLPSPAGTVDYTRLTDLTEQLPALLKDNPAFCCDGNFKSVYSKKLKAVAKHAAKVVNDQCRLAGDPDIEPLPRRRECTAADTADIALMQQLFDVNPDFVADYAPSAMALRRVVVAALQLIAHGCVIPRIFKKQVVEEPERPKRGRRKAPEAMTAYTVAWQPATIDESTRYVVDALGAEPAVFSEVITELVAFFSGPVGDDPISGMFFGKRSQSFDGIGESSVPGGIQAWLDIYFMHAGKEIAFTVGETEYGFSVDTTVDGKALKEILTDPRHEDIKIESLRRLAILCDMIGGLSDYINNSAARPIRYTVGEFSGFLIDVIPAMRLLGVKTVLPKSLRELTRPKATGSVSCSGGSQEGGFLGLDSLLRFDWEVAVGDETLSPSEFEELLGHATGLLRFKGKYVYMDEDEARKLHKILTEQPRLNPGEALQTALSGEYGGVRVRMTDEVRKMIETLTKVEAVRLPAGLNATLRPYQERGYSWMYRNIRIGLGSVIADDMGLGKTVQVIALLLRLKEDGELSAERKAMVVVPTGLLNNWQEEVARFAPSLSTAIYHGQNRTLAKGEAKEADILLTTYGVMRSDSVKLKKVKPLILVVDEAQNIKNSSTMQSKTILSIPASGFIAMSGTPVENRLSEFWSILNFTNRGYLGTLKEFSSKYAKPIYKFGDEAAAERFRRVTAPFIMRRLKTDKSIINDLPDKIERNEMASLTPEQAALYQQVVDDSMEVITGLDTQNPQTLFKRQGLILQMILALKQICNHPTQFLKNGVFDPALSGKTELLLDLVESISEAGEKVLVFTQFREMGFLLQRFVEQRTGEKPMFYHGGCSIAERKEMVDRFQNNPADRVFLLSLKAAGTGLNLTAASHVIHYDLWWNPAVEAQATDRAYRIGQHKNVQVYRFITKDTFEERIDDMIQSKRALVEMTVATGESWIGNLSNTELREIFG